MTPNVNYRLEINTMDFPGGSDGKESVCNAGDSGLIPGLGRSPGGGHGNPIQYSGLGDGLAGIIMRKPEVLRGLVV